MPKSDKTQNSPLPRLGDVVVACTLLTRIPMPSLPQDAYADQSRVVWAYPVAGALIGAVAAFFGAIAVSLGLGPVWAAGLILAVQIILTGAMHEDGLADTADGLWGGFAPARRLEIMKDSSIGTYGVLALILSVGLRWAALAALIPFGFGVIVVACALSRAPLPWLMSALPNARTEGLSRHVGRPDWRFGLLAIGIAVVVGLFLTGPVVFKALVVTCLAVFCIGLIADAKIGGQTGDILGAAQQTSEILILATFAAAL